MVNDECGNEFCEYFVENTAEGTGDKGVFRYTGLLACENYNCPYGNHTGQKFTHQLEGNPFGFCLSEGHKVRLEDKADDPN
jgi:hypothetical protein